MGEWSKMDGRSKLELRNFRARGTLGLSARVLGFVWDIIVLFLGSYSKYKYTPALESTGVYLLYLYLLVDIDPPRHYASKETLKVLLSSPFQPFQPFHFTFEILIYLNPSTFQITLAHSAHSRNSVISMSQLLTPKSGVSIHTSYSV